MSAVFSFFLKNESINQKGKMVSFCFLSTIGFPMEIIGLDPPTFSYLNFPFIHLGLTLSSTYIHRHVLYIYINIFIFKTLAKVNSV